MRGLDGDITRRDFLRGSLLGTGAALLDMPAPQAADQAPAPVDDWTGYAGVGDYARSNGNTVGVRDGAHLIRDGRIAALLPGAVDTGETYDVVIVGGGFAGFAAARTVRREGGPDTRCLLLENHPLPGGEAKRNEFLVDGHRLTGPQGSNLVSRPGTPGDWYDELWNDLRIPREPAFRTPSGRAGALRVARANYLPMFGIAEQTASAGYFFDRATFGVDDHWTLDASLEDYAGTAFPPAVRADLARLRRGAGENRAGDDWSRWLDGMTYGHYLQKFLHLQPQTVRLMDQVVSTAGGLGCDAVSALFAMNAGFGGFQQGFGAGSLYRLDPDDADAATLYSFPGGNDAVFRLLLKSVLPDAIAGDDSFEAVHAGQYRLDRLDRPGAPLRVRLDSTAVRVEHDGPAGGADGVTVTYRRGDALLRVRAKAVVCAGGAWVNKHIVHDLPAAHAQACASMVHGSNMIVNVALRHWRFMADLGISAAHFFNPDAGIGAFCNIRRPMLVGGEAPPLDPDQPVVLTFYVGFPQPGLPAAAQARKARLALLSRPYADIERAVRDQMRAMFGGHGFDDRRDIAGIVVNRWGHSYVVPTPGFYHGRDGRPPVREALSARFGRIAFGHSELNGVQEWFGAVEHGERAARQVLEIL